MKKRIFIFILGIFLILIGCGNYFTLNKTWLTVDSESKISIWLNISNKMQRLSGWREDGVYHFFLPSFVKKNIFYVGYLGKNRILYFDGEKKNQGERLVWEEGKNYHLEIVEPVDGQQETLQFDIVIYKSGSIPAVFINTESGDMEFIHQDKNNAEQGSISVMSKEGYLEYNGHISRISARGNSTWVRYLKKSYSFSLEKGQALCGLDKGKKWRLLALAREGTKLQTKLVMDIGQALKMRYSPQGVWVDLYLNGDYNGIYLLSESVSVGEGRVDIYDLGKENRVFNPNMEMAEPFRENDIRGYELTEGMNLSGGYLLEKDMYYYESKGSGFFTEKGHQFTIREPEYASRKQVEWIKNCIQNVENVLGKTIAQNYQEFIDLDSFVTKFLVDEISMNFDSYYTSAYFYKDLDNDLLYAGPLWDYDNCMGLSEGVWRDYDRLIVEHLESGGLEWFKNLYHDPVFFESMKKRYVELLPYLEEMLDRGIDEYVEEIRKSIEMDEIRWKVLGYGPNMRGYYFLFDNNVKYIKYFMANRLNYLNNKWGIDFRTFETPSDGTEHEVVFVKDGKIIEKEKILDGMTIETVPVLDDRLYEGWILNIINQKYHPKMPVYENMVFTARFNNID